MRVELIEDELDGGYVATSPDHPGLAGQGETERCAVASLFDAVNEGHPDQPFSSAEVW